jgi:hypothetical protein
MGERMNSDAEDWDLERWGVEGAERCFLAGDSSSTSLALAVLRFAILMNTVNAVRFDVYEEIESAAFIYQYTAAFGICFLQFLLFKSIVLYIVPRMVENRVVV